MNYNDRPRVSLDVESTLADAMTAFLVAYNDEYGTSYVLDDVTSWSWVIDHLEPGAFVELSDRMWAELWDEIPPLEADLAESVEELAEIADVDIVTARPGRLDEMGKWLDAHGIGHYDRLLSSERECKSKYGYSYYIDDKPGLAHNLEHPQLQLMPVFNFNRVALFHPLVVGVGGVRDAVNYIHEYHN